MKQQHEHYTRSKAFLRFLLGNEMRKRVCLSRSLQAVACAMSLVLLLAACDGDMPTGQPNVGTQIAIDSAAVVHQAIDIQEQLYGQADTYDTNNPDESMQQLITYWAYNVCGQHDNSATWDEILSSVTGCAAVRPGNLGASEFVSGVFGSLDTPIPASGDGELYWDAYHSLDGWSEASPDDIQGGKDVPQEGDIVSFSNKKPGGHVGIVVAVQAPQGGNDGFIIVSSAHQKGNVSDADLALLGVSRGDFYKLTWHSQEYLDQHKDAKLFEGYDGDSIRGFIRHMDYTNPTVLAVLPGASAGVSKGVASPLQGHYFAPYSENYDLVADAQHTGANVLTIAFVISSGGCKPLLDPPIVTAIKNLQAAGKKAIISFGGANGMELGQACTSVSDLEDAYQSVIDTCGVSNLDFDIEGAAVEDGASIDRRNQAIADLQSKNPDLRISYTLPVLTSGLVDSGLNILRSAIAHNVKLSIVNIMTMDYGSSAPGDQMGQNAIDAATATEKQLQQLYSSTSGAQLWGMIGITPMLGTNDQASEVFTLDDARQVLAFAQKQGIGELSFWEVLRDRPCGPEGGKCTGLNQDDFAFSHIFNQFN